MNYMILYILILATIMFFMTMIFSAVGAGAAGSTIKKCDADDSLRAHQYSKWAAISSGVAFAVSMIAMTIWILIARKQNAI